MKNRILLVSLVVALAVSVSLIGCGGEEIPEYSLTIFSTEGGKVTTPGEGVFVCDEGMVVDLVAEADEGYQFLNWTGLVGTIANANDAITTIAMNGHYSITANFELEQEDEEAPTEVVLGATLPVTGTFAVFGEQRFGMQKAVDDINAQGGIYLSKWNKKVPVRLIIKDDESDIAKAEPLATDLVVTDKVHALLSSVGPWRLPDPISVVANEYGVPHIIPGGPFEPWYYGELGAQALNYTWLSGFAVATRSAPPRDVDGYALVDTWFMYMDRVNARGNTNMIAGVFCSADADGMFFYDAFPPLMEDYGMTVVGVNESLGLFPMDAYDYTSIIQAWEDAGVEIIWGNCPGGFLGMLLSQCYEQDFRPKIVMVARAALYPVDVISWGTEPPLGRGMGTEVWCAPSYEAAEGFVGIGNRTAASLAEDWAEEMGKPLNQFIGPDYLGVQVMLDAIQRAGDVDPDAINEALGDNCPRHHQWLAEV